MKKIKTVTTLNYTFMLFTMQQEGLHKNAIILCYLVINSRFIFDRQ